MFSVCHLQLHEGIKKSGIMGLYDLCPGDPKLLLVEYTFRGQKYKIENNLASLLHTIMSVCKPLSTNLPTFLFHGRSWPTFLIFFYCRDFYPSGFQMVTGNIFLGGKLPKGFEGDFSYLQNTP